MIGANGVLFGCMGPLILLMNGDDAIFVYPEERNGLGFELGFRNGFELVSEVTVDF